MLTRISTKFHNILLRLESDSLDCEGLFRLKIEFELATVDFMEELQHLNDKSYKDYSLDRLKEISFLFLNIREGFRSRNIF